MASNSHRRYACREEKKKKKKKAVKGKKAKKPEKFKGIPDRRID